MTSVRQYLSNIDKPFLILKWKVKAESHLFVSTTLLTYVWENSNDEKSSDQEFKLKSTSEGLILELLVKEGDVVQPGSPLLVLKSCTHELIVKEICAQCGADLWKSGVFQSLPETDLKVTQEQAEQLERAGERELLRIRKLALLICVDKTLIVTVNNQEQTGTKETYCTKVRPGARDFLKIISQYFEVHIFVNGDISYANKIADILDASGELFDGRIWTRENCFDPEAESGNLKSIFPHGDSMVCIIDWHDGTFQEATSNIIHVRPFQDPSHQQNINTSENKPDITINNLATEAGNTSVTSPVLDNDATSPEGIEKIFQLNLRLIRNLMWQFLDPDEMVVIQTLRTLLVNIHKAYYELYDQMVKERMYIIHHKAIPDLKHVIPYFRQTILKGVNIVFSGVIPNNSDINTNPVCILAKSLGANITEDLVLHNSKKGTTHIIASKWGTNKTNAAKKFKNIHVVTYDWLFKCAAYWKRVDEEQFLLKKMDPNVSETFERKTTGTKLCEGETVMHNVPNSELNKSLNISSRNELPIIDDSQVCLTAALNLSPKQLNDMSMEVYEECSSDDTEDDEDTPALVGKRKRSKNARSRFSNCDKSYSSEIGSLSPVLDKNGSFKRVSVPIWQRPCDTDPVEFSDSESGCDYVYSEDEDNLIE